MKQRIDGHLEPNKELLNILSEKLRGLPTIENKRLLKSFKLSDVGIRTIS